MAMNKQRRTANLNNIVTYDTLKNVTLLADLTIEGLTGAGFVKADVNGLLSVDTGAYLPIPSQSGNSGKYLTTDGSNLSWGTVSTANIYNSDGTLTGNRTIGTTSNYTLTINPTTSFINSVTINAGVSYGEKSFQYSNPLGYITAIGNVSTGLTSGSTTAQGIRLSNPSYGGFYSYGTLYPGMYFGMTGAEQVVINSYNSLGLYAYGTARSIIKMHDGIDLIMSTIAGAGIQWGTNSNGNINASGKIFQTGNVTIGGTTDAGYKLDVQGTGRFTGNIYMLNDNGIVFNDNASTGRRFAITQDASVITNTGVESISIGYASYAYSLWSVALGTRVGIPSGYNSVVAVGYNFTVPGKGIYLQRNSFGLRMGSSATDRDIALGGYVNTGDVEGGTALGAGTSVSGGYGVAIGVWSVAGGQEFVAGASDGAGTAKPISNVYFGSGKIRGKGDGTATVTYTDGAGSSYTINGSGAYGTDFAGGNITIAGGKGTGTGTPGDVIFSTATALTTGTTLQSLTQRVWIKGGTGNLLVGSSTDGGQRFQVSGNAQVTHSYTHTTGSYTSGLTSYVLASTALSPSYTSGMFYGALNTSYQNEFEGSATIPNSVTMSSQLNRTTVKFVNANSTITMTQGGSGLRAIANQILQFTFDTAQTSCVVSHVAGSQILAPYYTGANNPTITNYYGLAINPSDEYSATLAVTNRWGVYQMGTSDNNWFAGKVIIGSTNTVGSSPLNVKGLPTSSAGLSSGDIWSNAGVLTVVP